MLIDLDQTYVNADDSPAITADTRQPVTLKLMMIQAILASNDGTSEDKLRRYSLYRTLKKAESIVELPVEDVAFLKKAATVFDTLVLGQTYEMLERGLRPSSTLLSGVPGIDG